VFKANEVNEGMQPNRNARASWGLRAVVAVVLAALVGLSVVVYRTDRLAMTRRARVAVLAAAWVLGAAASLGAHKVIRARQLAEAEEEGPAEATPEHVFVPAEVAQELAAQAAAQEAAEKAVEETPAEAATEETTAKQAAEETTAEDADEKASVKEAAEETQAEAQAAAEQPAPAVQRAYWTKSGKTYHVCRTCTALARSKDVREGALEDAQRAGKKSACNYCAGAKD
jgi:outer membrane biosynthesis protein TonB